MKRKWLILGALAPLVLAACGGGAVRAPAVFAWLKPAPAPADWKVVTLPSGSVLSYPPGWERVHADPGAASAQTPAPGSSLVGRYLNATPRQGNETLRDWAHFRPDHNADEGDRHVQVLASASGLRFRGGTGSCVIDRYRTIRAGYQEIACLVDGAHAQTVIVAAALRSEWATAASQLERAIAAFQA